MIAIDTNVLLRLITRDDAGQHRRADALVRRQRKPVFLGTLVLAEAAWVLARRYRYRREEIVSAIEALLSSKMFKLEQPTLIEEALRIYRAGPIGFSDALVALAAQEHDAGPIFTFDKAFALTSLAQAVPAR